MTDREKLTDVIYSMDICSWDWAGKIADHLLANGVTLATDNNVGNKWIPVSERLPEEGELVLCVGAKGGLFLGYPYWISHKETAYTSVPNGRGGRYTKYWMPLPSPPKEE